LVRKSEGVTRKQAEDFIEQAPRNFHAENGNTFDPSGAHRHGKKGDIHPQAKAEQGNSP
jgi:hypothetical protein